MPNFDSRMVDSGRGAMFPLPSEVSVKGRRVEVRRIVSRTQYFLVLAFAAVLCMVLIEKSYLGTVGWYLYDFATGDVSSVLECRSQERRTCSGSELWT